MWKSPRDPPGLRALARPRRANESYPHGVLPSYSATRWASSSFALSAFFRLPFRIARKKSLEKSDLEKVFTTIMLIVDLGTSVYGVVKAANTIYKSAMRARAS